MPWILHTWAAVLTSATIATGQSISSTTPIYLPNSPTTPDSTFGNRIAIHGPWMAIGADHDVPAILGSGEVYLYKHSGTEWEYRQRLIAPDGFPGNHFGLPVLLGEGVLMVGAPADDDLGYWSGSVYCYTLQDDAWVFDAKILPPRESNINALFGLTLSFGVDENELIVGSYLESINNSTSGAVYAFRFSDNNWQMTQRLVYPGTPEAAYFGRSVDVHNQKMAIGVPGLRTSQITHSHGGVVLYDRIGEEWVSQELIVPSPNQDFQLFGEWVDLHTQSLAVSSPGYIIDAQRSGAGYVFDIIDGAAIENSRIEPPISGTRSFSFPMTFSKEGNLLFLGAHSSDHVATDAGGSWIFQKTSDGGWGKSVMLEPAHQLAGDSFGRSMAFGNMNDAYVGSPRANLATVDSGAVFVFKLQDCDSSGVLDSWEIFAGELSDENADGTPDVCQTPPWDLNGDGHVDGSDMGIFFGYWGTDGSNGCDFNASGLVDSADMSYILTNWTQ